MAPWSRMREGTWPTPIEAPDSTLLPPYWCHPAFLAQYQPRMIGYVISSGTNGCTSSRPQCTKTTRRSSFSHCARHWRPITAPTCAGSSISKRDMTLRIFSALRRKESHRSLPAADDLKGQSGRMIFVKLGACRRRRPCKQVYLHR